MKNELELTGLLQVASVWWLCYHSDVLYSPQGTNYNLLVYIYPDKSKNMKTM